MVHEENQRFTVVIATTESGQNEQCLLNVQFGEVQAIYSFYSVPVAIAWGAENSNCPMEKVENAMIGYVRCYSVAS